MIPETAHVDDPWMYWEILKFRDSKFCKEWPLGKREWANEQNAWQFPCACKSLLGKSSGTGISNRSSTLSQIYPLQIPLQEFVEGTTGHYVEACANRPLCLSDWCNLVGALGKSQFGAQFESTCFNSISWKFFCCDFLCAISQIVVLCGWSDSIRSWVVAPPALEWRQILELWGWDSSLGSTSLASIARKARIVRSIGFHAADRAVFLKWNFKVGNRDIAGY